MRRAPLLSCLLWTAAAGCGETETFIDGALPAEVDLSTSAIAFGAVDCGTTPAPETLEVTNVGGVAVTWSAEIDGAGFTIDGATEGTVAPGATGSITIVPDPIPATAAAAADLVATLRVMTNTSAGELEVDLVVTPRGGSIALSPTLVDLGTTPVSTSATDVTVMVSNTGNAPVDVTIEDAAGDEFSLTYPGAPGAVTVAAGGNFSMTADFAPVSTAGTRTAAAAITIAGVHCATATEVPLTGVSSTGTLAFAAFPAMDAECGQATPTAQSLTLTNTSTTASVTVNTAEATGGFVVTTTLPITIPASGASMLEVRPPASVIGTDLGGATKTGMLSFTTNEAGNPTHTAALTSTVVGANLVLTETDGTTPVTAVSLAADSSCPSPRTVLIRNTGNADVAGFARSGSDTNFSFYTSPSSTIAASNDTSTTIAAFTTGTCEASDSIEYTWSTANVCTAQPLVLGASFTISGQSSCFCS